MCATTEGSKQYIYNQNQRLIQANNGGTTAYYTYNGNGQRVKKVVGGTTTIFHYSLNGQIIAESTGAGQIFAEYVYLNDQPLAKIAGGNTYYYHNDHLATPQKMTDSSGVVQWSADYKPFGEATITGSITNNLRFPGQYYDAETGLNYNYYRDYDPAIGRYKQADPIGLRGGINPYCYVKNRPLRIIDPYGLFNAGGPGTSQYGHGDFPGGDQFDYNAEDNDPATNPMNDPERHFRDLSRATADAATAIASCNKEAFERAMHRGQDYFSHYRQGYRWAPYSSNRCFGFGHACDGSRPDNNMNQWLDAAWWSQNQLDAWNKNCRCKK